MGPLLAIVFPRFGPEVDLSNINLNKKMSIVRITLLSFFLSSVGLFAQTGQLDPSFGVNGMAFVNVDTTYYSTADMAVQSDGKIVLTGRWQSDQGWDVYVIRCLPDGGLDQAFGEMGVVQTDLGSFWDEGRAVVVQPDGKIVVAAQSSSDGIHAIPTLIRYDLDGSLDDTFGTGGVAISSSTDFGSSIEVALKQGGEIVVVGSTSDDTQIAIHQFTSVGIPDSTFHSDGTFSASLAFGFNVAGDLVIQDDGSIVVAVMFGQSGAYDVGLVRLQSNEAYDPTFGDGGVAAISVSPGDETVGGLGVQSDGSLILAGHTDHYPNYDMFAARFTPNGTLDTAFGTDGITLISISVGSDAARDLVMQPDDAILLVGDDDPIVGDSKVALVRLSSDGHLDPEFGNNGIVLTPIPGVPSAGGREAGVQPDGRVIVAASGGIHPVLLRYLPGEQLGIPERFGTDSLISVSPNPASEMITVQFVQNSPSTVTLDLVDAGGRIVASSSSHQLISAGSHRIQLSIGQLAPGIYTVLFSAKGERQAMKLVKE